MSTTLSLEMGIIRCSSLLAAYIEAHVEPEIFDRLSEEVYALQMVVNLLKENTPPSVLFTLNKLKAAQSHSMNCKNCSVPIADLNDLVDGELCPSCFYPILGSIDS